MRQTLPYQELSSILIPFVPNDVSIDPSNPSLTKQPLRAGTKAQDAVSITRPSGVTTAPVA
ncbi:MAG TPA: hypothetical protein PKN64_17315 [Casimicrobium sp.]|nr:hypothetical protein [Casimicrobium sp.]